MIDDAKPLENIKNKNEGINIIISVPL